MEATIRRIHITIATSLIAFISASGMIGCASASKHTASSSDSHRPDQRSWRPRSDGPARALWAADSRLAGQSNHRVWSRSDFASSDRSGSRPRSARGYVYVGAIRLLRRARSPSARCWARRWGRWLARFTRWMPRSTNLSGRCLSFEKGLLRTKAVFFLGYLKNPGEPRSLNPRWMAFSRIASSVNPSFLCAWRSSPPKVALQALLREVLPRRHSRRDRGSRIV